MRGDYNYAIKSNESTKIAEFWEMVKFKMLCPLLIRAAPSIVLIAVVHPCKQSPFIRDSMSFRDVISKLLMTLESLKASIP